MNLPAPDHQLGHSEAQVRTLLGDNYDRFREQMLMKTTARDESGVVYYTGDLRWYLTLRERRYVPE